MIPTDKDYIPGARVVVAFKGGSPDIPESWNGVAGYTKTLQEKYGVKIVDEHRSTAQGVGRGHDREPGWPAAFGRGHAGD